jgi:hypothetical protein
VAARIGRAHLPDAVALLDLPAPTAAAVTAACSAVPLSRGELAVTGGELIAAGVLAAGPRVGEVLDELLARVWDDPTLHDRQRLLALAETLVADDA